MAFLTNLEKGHSIYLFLIFGVVGFITVTVLANGKIFFMGGIRTFATMYAGIKVIDDFFM